MLTSLFGAAETAETIYIRGLMAFFTALIIGLASGSKFITLMKQHQGKGQPIREDGPKSHLETKKGTPTMGGILIIASSLIATLLWANLNNPFIWSLLIIYLIYAGIGFADDYVKVSKNSSNAITGPHRLMMEFAASLVSIAIISYFTAEEQRFALTIPYFKDWIINLSWFYVPFAMFVIVGTANSVNLSDGLDGLAGGLCTIAFATFGIIVYVAGTAISSEFNIAPLTDIGEITVLISAVIGGCIAFLWFNAAPAKIFMGDTGSLALGGLLGTIAVAAKQEILLAIIGAIFVIEALSDIIQVFWYKRTKRRVFLMAPIHHHFEQLGWKETTVVTRFWIIGLICAILGLLSLTL